MKPFELFMLIIAAGAGVSVLLFFTGVALWLLGKIKGGTLARKHKHKWINLSVNKWSLPTSQSCSCGIYREVNSKADSKNISRNHYWYYSDGDITPDERVFKHV